MKEIALLVFGAASAYIKMPDVVFVKSTSSFVCIKQLDVLKTSFYNWI